MKPVIFVIAALIMRLFHVSGLQIKVVIKNTFLISQPKHILWVLKRTVVMGTQNIC